MQREEVVAFIRKETKRLREQEHLDDLVKANRFDELSQLECQITISIRDFFDCDYLYLKDEEIAEGDCMATVIWCATCADDKNENLFENVERVACRLAKKAGPMGKNVAALMLDGYNLYDIHLKELFSDQYASEYDEKYGLEKF